jgi:peptidoglycan/xylan/chitin deacetylase (PgdA/CDA1 family)
MCIEVLPLFPVGRNHAVANTDVRVDVRRNEMISSTLTLTSFLGCLILQGLGNINTHGSVPFRDFAVQSHEWLHEAPATTNGDQYYAAEFSMLPVYVDCCDDSSQWQAEHVVLSDVSTLEGERAYLCGDRSFQSILVQKAPDTSWGFMSKQFAAPMDFSGSALEARIKVPRGSGDSSYDHILSVHIRFADSAGAFAQYAIPCLSPGWQRRQCTRTDTLETSGDLDWTQITTCTIGFLTKKIGQQPAIIVDRIVVFRPAPSACGLFDRPIIINTLDDGAESHYDTAAYLSGKCMSGTFYVIGETVQWGGWLTLAELTDMHWAGHLVANHTWSHKMPFRELTPAEQIEEVIRMQEFMCENGFADGARILSLPGNEWTAPVRDLLLPYVDHVRGSSASFSYQRNPMIDPTLLSPTAGLETARIAIEQALAPDEPPSIVVFIEHGLKNRMAEFKAYVDYLAQKRDAGLLSVITPVDLLVWHDRFGPELYAQAQN